MLCAVAKASIAKVFASSQRNFAIATVKKHIPMIRFRSQMKNAPGTLIFPTYSTFMISANAFPNVIKLFFYTFLTIFYQFQEVKLRIMRHSNWEYLPTHMSPQLLLRNEFIFSCRCLKSPWHTRFLLGATTVSLEEHPAEATFHPNFFRKPLSDDEISGFQVCLFIGSNFSSSLADLLLRIETSCRRTDNRIVP